MYVNIDSVINNEPRLTDELVSDMWERWTDMDSGLERQSTQAGSLTTTLWAGISGLNQIS